MSENVWFLKRCQLFGQLSDDCLRHVESRSRIRRFSRGSPVYLPSENAHDVLLLVSGRVKICSMTREGKQGILTLIDPGEVFGELSLFDQTRREDYAEAIETSTIMRIPCVEMQVLLETYPAVSMGITKLIGFRRRRIERRLKYLLFHSNRQRLVHLLFELSEDYGVETRAGIELAVKLSHQDLASVIGSTRETVTVTLGELQREGSLLIRRRKIVLIDVDRLAKCIDEPSPPRTSAKRDLPNLDLEKTL